MKLRYVLIVTGPAYGTQQSSGAYQFAETLLKRGHQLDSVFFYREGVLNANQLISPASDEFDLVKAWQKLAKEHQVKLHVCVAAALRRGIVDQIEANNLALEHFNLAQHFILAGLGTLSEALLLSDRTVQF